MVGDTPPATSGLQTQVWRSSRGEVFPVGTQLRASYRGNELRATITPEGIEFAGKTYDNPSSAGIAAKNSVGVTGDAAATNGWKFWEIQEPGTQRWVLIDVLRTRPLQGALSALEQLVPPGTLSALPQGALSVLKQLTPQEAKALRKRFGIDTDTD